MDRVMRLKGQTRGPPETGGSRLAAAVTAAVAAAAGTRDRAQRRQPTQPKPTPSRTRRGHQGVLKKRRELRVVFDKYPFEEVYTCRLSLLTLLHAQSYDTARILHHDDSQRSIKYDYGYLLAGSYRISFETLVSHLGNMKPEALLSQLPHLDALEENVANALHLLHPHNISFPVFPDQIQFSVPSTYDCRCGDISSFRLFLPLNYKARWASSKLPPTWKADELSRVKSLFFILKVLTRLGAAPTLLDLSTQEVLTTSLTDHNYVFLHHEDYCLGIAPIIPELAHRIAYNLVSRGKAEESLKALESFFNGPMLLPEPGTSPHTIYENFACLRSRIIHEKYSSSSSSSSTYLDPDLEAKLLLDSPVTFTRLFCCRAEIATTLEEPDLEQWWLTAMNLHDEFPPSEEYTRLDTICATDMYGVRRRARQR